MKKITGYVFLLLQILTIGSYINGGQAPTVPTATPPTTPVAITPTTLNNHEALSVFAAIDFPLSSVSDAFTQNIFNNIDTVFTKTTYPLDPYQISLLKKTYLYLIFLTKLEKIKTVAAFKQYQPDFKNFLKTNNTQLPHLPSEKLITSSGWSAVVITAQDLLNSQAWQLFCQSMICDVYVYYAVVLQMIHNVEKQTFNYIPHIETSYYNADYTSLRTVNEITRIKLILENNVKQYFLAQCPSWSTLQIKPAQAAKSALGATTPPVPKNPLALEAAVVAFRQTPFYKITHDMHLLSGAPKTQSLNKTPSANMLSGPHIASPLKEHIWCYLMLYEVHGQLTAFMNEQNIQELLTTWATNTLPINIFPYRISDFVLLDELLAVKGKTEGTNANSIHPSPANFKPEEIRPAERLLCPHGRSYGRYAKEQIAAQAAQEVQAQWFWDSIAHAVTHAFSDVKNAVEKAVDTTVDIAKAVGQGIVGLGATAIGDITDDSSISNWGNKEYKDSQKDLASASTDLADSITDFTKSLEDGIVAPFAEVTGDLVGFIIDDQKIGQDMTSMINSVTDTLANLSVEIMITLPAQSVIAEAQADMRVARFTEKFAATVADAAVVVFTAGQYGKSAFLKNGEELIKNTISAIVNTMKGLMKMGEGLLKIVMTGLGAIINSLTSLFIDLSAEVTFLATGGIFKVLGLSSLPGLKQASAYATQTRDHTYNVLNAHRQTINQCMGVAIAVAADVAIIVCTAGTGTGAAVALDVGIMGAAAGAEVAGSIAVETAVEVGATVATEAATTAATTAVTTAATTVAETTAETVAETVATEAVSTTATTAVDSAGDVVADTAETAAEDTAEDAAEDTTEDTAEDGAEDEPEEDEPEEDEGEAKPKPKSNLGKVVGMVMNVGFGLFNIVGGYNQDQMAILQEENQARALSNLWKFINENKLSTAKQESAFLQELQEKQQAEIGNQTIALALYQNQTNTNVDGLQKQIASNIAPLYVQLLTPDPTTNLLPADIGYSWGIHTNYLNLYPSQGFFTATTGNKDFPFAQEVAQSPLIATSAPTAKKLSKQTVPDKLWFNQRSIALDAQDTSGNIKKPLDPLTVQIDLQFIYTLNSAFHVGLYLGGNYDNYVSPNYLARLLNTTVANVSQALTTLQTFLTAQKPIPANIINSGMIDLDAAHLAKMVVLYRDSATDSLHLGVYEHEGLQWILQQALPASVQLDTQHTYQLKATLNETSLIVELLADKSPNAVIQKTIAVSKIANQRTYGVICSGAAIMWNQVSPAPQLIPNGAARPKTTAQSEIEREKQAKLQLATALHPKFSSFSLKPISKQGILFGQYIYATTDTDLKKINPASKGDFVVFASNENGIISNIGQSPSEAPATGATLALISLVTGTVYDGQGDSIATVGNVWSTYETGHGPFSPTLGAYITAQQAMVIKLLTKINFGKFRLDIINAQALQSGQYIYKSMQTLINAKDSAGNAIPDYLVMAEVASKALGSAIGMAPTSSNAKGLLSLVTGNLYAKNTVFTTGATPTPLIQYNSSAQFGSYANQYNISQATQTIITTAQTAYDAYLTAQSQPKPTTVMPIIKITPITQVTAQAVSGIHMPLNGFTIGSSDGAPGIHLRLPGQGNVAQRQQQAAGSSGFQLAPPASTGVHLKL